LAYVLRFLGNVWAALTRLLLLPLYAFSGLMPRRANLWVFGSWGGQRYADNAAAFFEYCRDELDGQVDVVWISRRSSVVSKLRGFGATAHLAWSPSGMFYCLRAGLHIFDCFAKDTNFWLSRGAALVNLWSGVPLKTFERDIDNPRNRYFRLFHGYWFERVFLSAMMPWHVVRPDLIIATSSEHRDIVCRAFDVPVERVAVTGYPRNHCLLEKPDLGKLPKDFADSLAAGRRVCIYLPTFRDSGRSFIDFDWSRLDEVLEQSNASLFVKFHPLDATQLAGSFRHIHSLGREADIYRLLPESTALISDYSSVIWDYMLLRRPIIYFVPDLEAFKSHSRAMNFNIDDIAVGPVCRNFDELLRATSQVLQPDYAEWADTAEGEKMLARIHQYVDGEASARVLAAIEERVLGGPAGMAGVRSAWPEGSRQPGRPQS
jgi:CDP-glycerol glycerophosphotransferase (TagB/SpsB family)